MTEQSNMPSERVNLEDFRQAPSGSGPLAAEWADKPHRLIYDLADECDKLARERNQLITDANKTDTAIRKSLESVLAKERIYGDSDFVPPVEDLVQEVCGRLKACMSREVLTEISVLRERLAAIFRKADSLRQRLDGQDNAMMIASEAKVIFSQIAAMADVGKLDRHDDQRPPNAPKNWRQLGAEDSGIPDVGDPTTL